MKLKILLFLVSILNFTGCATLPVKKAEECPPPLCPLPSKDWPARPPTVDPCWVWCLPPGPPIHFPDYYWIPQEKCEEN